MPRSEATFPPRQESTPTCCLSPLTLLPLRVKAARSPWRSRRRDIRSSTPLEAAIAKESAAGAASRTRSGQTSCRRALCPLGSRGWRSHGGEAHPAGSRRVRGDGDGSMLSRAHRGILNFSIQCGAQKTGCGSVLSQSRFVVSWGRNNRTTKLGSTGSLIHSEWKLS
jgi:hypothetical protein